MKKRTFLISLVIVFAVEIAMLVVFSSGDADDFLDAVTVNEAVQSVQTDWNKMESHENQTGLDYVVLDGRGRVVFKTKKGLSESLNAAVIHRDTILDIEAGGAPAGKIIIYNDSVLTSQSKKQMTVMAL